MSWPIPTSEQQLWFIRNVQRLMDGQFTSTYKFALLQALADLAVSQGDDTGAPLHLQVRDIAERFIELYWRHARPFYADRADAGTILRQNTGRQAAIVKTLSHFHTTYAGSLSKFRKEQQSFERTVRDFSRRVQEMPLWRLQRVGNDTLEFLYPNLGSGDVVVLFPGVAYCFRRYYGIVSDLVQSAWLRFVRRLNTDSLRISEDLVTFMFETERAALDPYREVLVDLQQARCFYCGTQIKGSGAVDHFVPWARYPADIGHNFVLADSTCNGQKSDHLASLKHLEAWVKRNQDHKVALDQAFREAGVASNPRTAFHIARWAYTQTSQLGSLVWHEKQQLIPLDSGWEAALTWSAIAM